LQVAKIRGKHSFSYPKGIQACNLYNKDLI
jgi:hypothetical protein